MMNPKNVAKRSGNLEKEVIPAMEKAIKRRKPYFVRPAARGGLTKGTVVLRNPTHRNNPRRNWFCSRMLWRNTFATLREIKRKSAAPSCISTAEREFCNL